MGTVYLNPIGNGTAWTDATEPMVEGETFHIISTPDPGESLRDVRAFDSHDFPVAIPVSDDITMKFRTGWGSLYVDIYFSGSGPTPPPPPPPGPSFPIAILFNRDKWRH